MLHHAHFDLKGGLQGFAALGSNVPLAQHCGRSLWSPGMAKFLPDHAPL
jgi:hypothetical protein